MNLDLYCQVMNEIKKRTNAINLMLEGRTNTGYNATNIEFCCIQIRKILELISLGSLVANQKEFANQSKKYQQYYHAERILRDIKNINPSYYPQPVIEEPANSANIKSNIIDLKSGYLTENQFIKVYEKCGKIAHAENPFGSKIDYKYYEDNLPEWRDKIVKLLNSHRIKLLDDNNLYIIHMAENRDEYAHGYIFGKVE